MFLPETEQEIRNLGWDRLDVILVTGDAYIDSPLTGVAVIGKVLLDAGYRVGVIAQPDTHSPADITRLGEPLLFWGVTAGCVDSMVSNYTPAMKRRRRDDLTPGGINTRRPDMATIVYTNLIRRYFKPTRPIVLGGIEASLRRMSHYDYWTDSIRRSVLCDAKADILVYGMGERTVVELARRMTAGLPIAGVRGICYMSRERPDDCVELPSHAKVASDMDAFQRMYKKFYSQSLSWRGKPLCQLQDTRYLVQTPPQPPLTTKEMDHVYGLDYQRDVHPHDREAGDVRALETMKFSIVTHRGCYGGCSFCSIAVHEGPIIMERSEESILQEARRMTKHPGFKGTVFNVGGASANMYGSRCAMAGKGLVCKGRQCLWPEICDNLKVDHKKQADLLRKIAEIPGVKKVFVRSGIRHDIVLHDSNGGRAYLEALVAGHISGQLRLAPEHSEPHILKLMRKPRPELFLDFIRMFGRVKKAAGKNVFFSCYFIAAFPGCTMDDMQKLRRFVARNLRFRPEQVQIFTPTPSTWATMMYYTGRSIDGDLLFVEKNIAKKQLQKRVLTGTGSKDTARVKQVKRQIPSPRTGS